MPDAVEPCTVRSRDVLIHASCLQHDTALHAIRRLLVRPVWPPWSAQDKDVESSEVTDLILDLTFLYFMTQRDTDTVCDMPV